MVGLFRLLRPPFRARKPKSGGALPTYLVTIGRTGKGQGDGSFGTSGEKQKVESRKQKSGPGDQREAEGRSQRSEVRRHQEPFSVPTFREPVLSGGPGTSGCSLLSPTLCPLTSDLCFSGRPVVRGRASKCGWSSCDSARNLSLLMPFPVAHRVASANVRNPPGGRW
jgi:hypothetical protein